MLIIVENYSFTINVNQTYGKHYLKHVSETNPNKPKISYRAVSFKALKSATDNAAICQSENINHETFSLLLINTLD